MRAFFQKFGHVLMIVRTRKYFFILRWNGSNSQRMTTEKWHTVSYLTSTGEVYILLEARERHVQDSSMPCLIEKSWGIWSNRY